jgi:putative Holliday junction resolvase
MKILAVDPGRRNIGLAVCDETGTAARALTVLSARTPDEDCTEILRIAAEQRAEMILLGLSHEPGAPASSGARTAHRLLARLRSTARIPVRTADESFSTRDAREVRVRRGDPKQRRRTPDDALAAAVFLQEYLDAHPSLPE